jgi:Secretion system C-terminal sorting domain
LVQLDGSVQYSEPKTVKFSTFSTIKIFPNPTEDVLNIALKGYDTQPIEVVIFDMQGKVIFNKQYEKTSNTTLSIPLSEKAVAGQYMLLMKSKGKKDVMRTFTVSK